MKASVALEAWLDSTEQRQVDVVRALDVSKQLVSFWVTGRGVPGLKKAEALERLTDGAVKVMDWREPAAVADQGGKSRARAALISKALRLRSSLSTSRSSTSTSPSSRSAPRSSSSRTRTSKRRRDDSRPPSAH